MNALKDKIALITGGTSGMGAATAKRFHEEGATVIVTGSSKASVEAACKAMPYVEAIASDAGDPKAAKALVDHIKEKYGRLNILFVNAGIARVAPLPAVDEAQFDELFRVNVRGPYFLLKFAVPVILDGGSIILTSSMGAVQGMPGLSVYSATKAALRSFGLTLAAELASRRIRVNTITPGPINTPIAGKMGLSPEQIASFGQMVANGPLGRPGEPEEIAAAALYYASDESKFTTGTELRVDGGISAVQFQPSLEGTGGNTMRQSSTETLKSFFGKTGVATIGEMEANLPELAKLVGGFVLDKARSSSCERDQALFSWGHALATPHSLFSIRGMSSMNMDSPFFTA